MSRDHKSIAKFYNETYYADLAHRQKIPSTHLKKLANKLMIQPGQKVLDVACGTGEWLSVLGGRGAEVSGIDISERAISACKQALPHGIFFSGVAESLPFPSGEFDLITCLGSLEHFIDQPSALREMVRVAKPEAEILILVPNSGFLTYRLGLYRGTHQQVAKETIRSLSEWSSMFSAAELEVKSKWKDLHVLSIHWIFRRPYMASFLRAAQAFLLVAWPLQWQYQVYHLCSPRKSVGGRASLITDYASIVDE